MDCIGSKIMTSEYDGPSGVRERSSAFDYWLTLHGETKLTHGHKVVVDAPVRTAQGVTLSGIGI